LPAIRQWKENTLKDQYFGDSRDLFKYDVVLELLLETPIRQFTFIPMRTARAANRHGGKTDYSRAKAGTRRTELARFLQACIRDDRRHIGELETFFRTCQLTRETPLTIYRKDQYFSDANRDRYFEEIPPALLREAVILLDPDNGLEVPSARPGVDKYVKYREVHSLFKRMEHSSALMLFQFIPRVKRTEHFSRICRNLRDEIAAADIVYVSDKQVVFFILTKSEALHRRIDHVILRYGQSYQLMTGRG